MKTVVPGRAAVFKGVDLPYLQWLVVAIAIAFPVTSLSVPKAVAVVLYLLLIGSLIGIACRIKPSGKSFVQLVRDYWPVHLAMAGLLLATLMHQVVDAKFLSRAFELPFQLACFPFLVWILLLVPRTAWKFVQLSIAGGAFACAAAIVIASEWGALRPMFVLNVPIIPYANITLTLGILSLLSLGWNDRRDTLAIAFKILGGLAALYGSYLSQARGGWVALPLFAILALFVFKNVHVRHKLGFLAVAASLLCGVYLVSDTIQARVAAAGSDVQQFIDGTNKDTSIGLRLQLWQGGWMLFKEHPLTGISRKQYPAAVDELAAHRIISPAAAEQPHAHNDLLFQAISLGIFGFSAILSLYAVPAYYFFREIHNPDRELRTTAGMGLALTLGFFVFGLSDTMFFWRVTFGFYVILLAMIFACLLKCKMESSDKQDKVTII